MNPQPNENFIDCTLGNAGHAIEILKKTAPRGKILAFELDTGAIEEAKARLKEEGVLSRVEIINDNFRFLKKYLPAEISGATKPKRSGGISAAREAGAGKSSKVNGILADLGLRSGQLESGGGGFSFQHDEPLDMRFGNWGKSAEEIINEYTKTELEDIFRKYGEERNAKPIADAIYEARKNDRIKTTGELAEIILEFYRRKLKTKKEVPWVGGIYPATRVFQALRIEANDELGSLEQLLEDGVGILSSGGRMGIISYHSLEDRIVKRFYRTSPHLVILTKKPIMASEEEAQSNRRSRSAKLRVALKIPLEVR